MAAWATSKANKAQRVLNQVTNYYPISLTSAFLVNDPTQGYAGYQMLGHLYAGGGYWSKGKDMMFQRSDHGAVAYNSQIFIFGGLSNDPQNVTLPKVLDNVVKYDMYTGEVTEVASMPSPLYRFGYAILGNVLYVFGGFQAYDDGTASSVGATFAYNFDTNTWKTLPTSLNIPRSDCAGAAVGGKVYVAGGYSAADFSTLNSVEVLDPSAALPTWRTAKSLPTARGDLRAVSMNGTMYVLGGAEYVPAAGIDCNGPEWMKCYQFSKKVEAFDPTTGNWTAKAPMQRGRGDFAVEVLPNGRIFVAGGEGTNGVRNEIATPWVEEYIVEHNLWITKALMPEARFRFDVALVYDMVYAFGGAPTCPETSPCYQNGLETVYGFADNLNEPNIYAMSKIATE